MPGEVRWSIFLCRKTVPLMLPLVDVAEKSAFMSPALRMTEAVLSSTALALLLLCAEALMAISMALMMIDSFFINLKFKIWD